MVQIIVGLHSWSEGYRQDESVIYAEWCIANDWVFVHPPPFRLTLITAYTMGAAMLRCPSASRFVPLICWQRRKTVSLKKRSNTPRAKQKFRRICEAKRPALRPGD
jgi:hypothetical protein